jgi:SAM-dependent methyltransferase
MTGKVWQESLQLFFAERGRAVTAAPSWADLCFIAGREPRLWREPGLYDDLIASILEQCAVGLGSSVLEVGCAAGFLARGVAPRVASYFGVDLAKPPLRVAARLGLRNARFRVGDGAGLGFSDSSFDAAFCYDVFTNFPQFTDGVPIIQEMLRVVRPGGRALVGSVPDSDTKEAFEAQVAAVTHDLNKRYGAPPAPPSSPKDWLTRLRVRDRTLRPEVLCYYFSRDDFIALGWALSAKVEIHDIHSGHPYRGFRYNVVYTKLQ